MEVLLWFGGLIFGVAFVGAVLVRGFLPRPTAADWIGPAIGWSLVLALVVFGSMGPASDVVRNVLLCGILIVIWTAARSLVRLQTPTSPEPEPEATGPSLARRAGEAVARLGAKKPD